jgi:hypothetical protein
MAHGGGRQVTNVFRSIKRGLEQAIEHRKRSARVRRRAAEPRESLAEFVRNSPLAGTQLYAGRRRSTKRS